MGKFRKYFSLIISACLFLSCLTACGKPSPASLGIEKPGSGGLDPIEFRGLAVYGNAKINSASRIASIEIETSKLSKIKEGYKVNVYLDSAISYNGLVKGLPDTNNIGDSSTCTIEAALDTDSDLDLSDDTEYSARIYLPAKDGIWVVYRECIEDGNDDKKYAWVSKKSPAETQNNIDSFELVEVKTGETDGKSIEITEGLKGFKTIFYALKNMK